MSHFQLIDQAIQTQLECADRKHEVNALNAMLELKQCVGSWWRANMAEIKQSVGDYRSEIPDLFTNILKSEVKSILEIRTQFPPDTLEDTKRIQIDKLSRSIAVGVFEAIKTKIRTEKYVYVENQ